MKEAEENDVALELNSHYEVETDSAMLKEILEQNAKIAFGTDSHRREEAGDFSYHISLLEKHGVAISALNVFSPVSPS